MLRRFLLGASQQVSSRNLRSSRDWECGERQARYLDDEVAPLPPVHKKSFLEKPRSKGAQR